MVLEGHGEAVHFVLADIADVSFVAGERADAAVPVAEFLFAGDVVDGKHRPRVSDLGEALFGLAADALGGRVGSHEGGVGSFEALQLADEIVVFGVGDGGLVEDVIEVLVVADFIAEGVDFLLDVGHAEDHGKTGEKRSAKNRLAKRRSAKNRLAKNRLASIDMGHPISSAKVRSGKNRGR